MGDLIEEAYGAEVAAAMRGSCVAVPDPDRAARALDALTSTWAQAGHATANELAVAFRHTLQAQPDLMGRRLPGEWIEARYPAFCASLGVRRPPPYKDFAKELAEEMPRKRQDLRRNGRRETFTTYLVPLPPSMAGATIVC